MSVVMVTVVDGVSMATVNLVFASFFVRCLQNSPLLDFDRRFGQNQSLAVSEDFGASAAVVPEAPVSMATASMAPAKPCASNAFASSYGFDDLAEMLDELMINFQSSAGAPSSSPSWHAASDAEILVNYGPVASTPKSLVKAPEPLASSFGSAAAAAAPSQRSTNPFLTDIFTSNMSQQSSSSSQNPFLAPKSSFSLPNGRSSAAAGNIYPSNDWLNQPANTRGAAALPPLVDTATVSGVSFRDCCVVARSVWFRITFRSMLRWLSVIVIAVSVATVETAFVDCVWMHVILVLCSASPTAQRCLFNGLVPCCGCLCMLL